MISVNYVNVPRVERKTELVFSPTSCTKLTVFQPGSIVILIEPHCSGHVSPIPGLTCLLIDRSNVVQASCSHTNGHMSQTGPKKCFIPQNCRKYTNFD